VSRARLGLAVAVPLLWAGTLVSAAGAIWCTHRTRALFIESERLAAQRDNLDVEWGRLQLEQSAWSTQAFVENVAATRLHMLTPAPQDIRVISP